MNFRLVLVGLVLAAASAAMPAAAYSHFGAPDCGKWVSAPSVPNKTWLLGFMSGMNAQQELYLNDIKAPYKVSDPLDQINSAEQIFLWMDNYCRANPLKTVADGGIALYTELIARKRGSKP